MNCALCLSDQVTKVMDFGEVALAGAFLKRGQFSREKKYPLTLHFCHDCTLAQVGERLDPEILFRDYFYRSSAIGTLRSHFSAYAKHVVDRFKPKTVVEIGCNDGVMLRALIKLGVQAIGVDPSSAARAASLPIINDFFGPHLIDKLGPQDMVIANNVFAHIPDLNGATQAIRELLAGDGVFVMEAHYLGKMIEGLQYDWIYHEHLYYYSLGALESHFHRHGLMVFDCEPVKLHAGAMRYYVCKEGTRTVTDRVKLYRAAEAYNCLDKIETFHRFAQRAHGHRGEMRAFMERAKTVAGYGACGRANTMIQFCGIDLQFMIDDAPAKQGYYTPGSHIPIVSRDEAANFPTPKHLMIFAWSFLDEIRDKIKGYTGHVVLPLPSVRVMQPERIAA